MINIHLCCQAIIIYVFEPIKWLNDKHMFHICILFDNDNNVILISFCEHSNGETDIETTQTELMLHIEHTGKVIWMSPVKYTSACKVDMLHYPFDVQTCKMKFGSWVYDMSKLDLEFMSQKGHFDMDEYVPNTEWEMLNNTAERTTAKYACCANKYVDITYTLTLKRCVTFHLRLILVPTVILSLLTLLIFWIPPNRPDRNVIGEYEMWWYKDCNM